MSQSARPKDLLPVLGVSYPGFEGHFLWIGTYLGASDTVQMRLLLTTHGAPGWTEVDTSRRERIRSNLEELRASAARHGSRIAFLDYGTYPVLIEQRPGQSGFTLNGVQWEWAPGDSLLVIDVNRVDSVGGPPELMSVRIAAPFAPRFPYRELQARTAGVVFALQSDAVAGPLLRLSPERR